MLPASSDYFKATQIAEVIRRVLTDELRLEAPAKYWMAEDGQYHWLIAVMDAQNLRHPIGRYTHEGVRHQLSTAVGGLPVALSNSSGLRFGVLLSGKPQLPKAVTFPGMPAEPDVFRFGMGLRGEINLHAGKIINMIVGGGQDSGKSTFLRMMAHTARAHGAKIYLIDPQAHTFSDVWNSFAAMPVAGSRPETLTLLGRMQAEVEERSALFRLAALDGIPPEDIAAYNAKVGGDGRLPRIWLIGDEMNTYLSDRGVQEKIAELARVGRKWGVHLALAGHNWRSEDIPRGLSAMFPTRLCLRVADDTSGRVTLDDHRWGRKAMAFRVAGRAVLRAGSYQVIQLYQIATEQEREWLAGAVMPSALPEVEADIVRRAVEETGGKLTLNLLAGWGMGQREARRMLDQYESRGWLSRDANQGNARVVTAKLVYLATNRQSRQSRAKPVAGCQSLTNPADI